jgi:acyl carrier protein
MNARPGSRLDRQEVSKVIRRVLSEMTQRDATALDESTRLFLDLGLTSTNAVELVMLLSEEFGMKLKPESLGWEALETLGSVIDYVAAVNPDGNGLKEN